MDQLVLLKVEESTRKVVHRSPSRTVYLLNIARLSKPIEAESTWEVGFVYRAALLAGVTRIQHQPFRLELTSGRYTPDFAIGMYDAMPRVVVEVKPKRQISKYREVFDEAATHFQEKGLVFYVLTEKHLQGGHYLRSRASEVLRYRRHQVTEQARARVISLLESHADGIPIAQLAQEAGVSRQDILALAAYHAIQINADIAISDLSLVSIAPSPGEDHAHRFGCWFGATPWSAAT